MENQIVRDMGCDILVAKYALIVVEYRSVNEALEIIFGGFDEQEDLKHPFFGYVPDGYNPTDIEAGFVDEKCFICGMSRSRHAKD